MVTYKTGNILDSTENIIVQQVNYQGVMGAGLALQIRQKYPGILDEYRKVCQTYSWEDIRGNGVIHLYLIDRDKYVCNIFGQKSFGKGLQTDYASLKNGMIALFEYSKENDFSVSIPYGIGCGLAGGDWVVVSKIINDIFSKDVDCVLYKLED